jgi:hypothetical protein
MKTLRQTTTQKEHMNDKKFALLTAALITCVIFSVFFAQQIISGMLTFEKSGDNLKLCFPAFMKLGEYLTKGSLNGVDVGIFNGATEFFFRSNLPNMYLPAIIFAKLMLFIPNRFVYLLFYMLHMVVALFFAQRLAQRFFKLNKWISLLFAICVNSIIISEDWYLSFYIIAALTCPLLYFSFCALEERRKSYFILFSIPYVFAFTSGYITLSVTLVGISVLSTLFYGLLFMKNEKKKFIVIKTIIPPFIAGMFSVLFCFELLDYVDNVLQRASSTIFDTLYYNFNIRNLPLIISTSFSSLYPIEQMRLITIGVIWCIVIYIIISKKCFADMSKEHRYLLFSSSLIYIAILLIALGMLSPLVLWFYSFVPILGSMHIPMRYMMITMPLLYIALCICIQYLPEQKNKVIYKRLAAICSGLAIGICLLSQYHELKIINTASMVLELLLIAIVFYCIFFNGINNKITIIFWCITIILPSLNTFYQTNEVNSLNSTIKERSIVYNEDYQRSLDNFITTLDTKDLYKYAAFDSINSVPEFIPGNYQWYGYSNYNITNYMGYEPQLSVPSDYMARFWWFNKMDWIYMVNTRGDFLILDEQSIQDNMAVLDIIVDWANSNTYINPQSRMLRLKKFIPTYYTGKEYIEDHPDAMDNGYFYSHDLRNDSLLEFNTDNATYYKVKINAVIESNISFLLYPNRYYHYYIDNKEVKPIIDNMQVYIPVAVGEHEITVKYENNLNEYSNYLYCIYYLIVTLVIIYLSIERISRKFKK